MPKYHTITMDNIPAGMCMCGCNTKLASTHNTRIMFIKGHNSRVRRHAKPIKERLNEKTTIHPNGCWIWTGRKSGQMGYGSIWVDGKSRYIHRVSYQIFHGEIPENVEVCHTCDTPQCWNPSHLFLGTRADNVRDCIKKKRHAMFTNPEMLSHKGESHTNAKLTDAMVASMRSLHKEQGMGPRRIAQICGVPFSTVSKVIYYNAWRHLP